LDCFEEHNHSSSSKVAAWSNAQGRIWDELPAAVVVVVKKQCDNEQLEVKVAVDVYQKQAFRY
jgi:hypothetical protein